MTWDIHGGLPFDEAAKEELFAELEKPYVSGVTLSGGDPLHLENRRDAGELIGRSGGGFPGKPSGSTPATTGRK